MKREKKLSDIDDNPYFKAHYQICVLVSEYMQSVTGFEKSVTDGATVIKNDDGSYTFSMTVRKWR